MPSGVEILRVPRSWGTLGKSCNTLPVLTENEAKRTIEVIGKIEPGGYFDVSKVLGSRTLKKHFALGRMEVSSSGGDKSTSGDEGKSLLSRGVLQRGSPSRGGDSVKWIGGKVQDPFTNLFPKAMSSRISPSALNKKAGEKATTKECWLGGDISTILEEDHKEKVEQFTSDDLVTKSFHAMLEKRFGYPSKPILVKNRSNPINPAFEPLAELGEHAAKVGAELKDKSEVMARLEAKVAELTSKLVQAKKLAIEEFKSSDDFKHPNLGIDVASMEMDGDFAEEEAAVKEGEANPAI
ncbi:hypothetical protein Acr_14g0006750 [Actinidia rufa]|uniref:Uncharacterized protein n=1 Tax=Actinidia rufa TaxID=165716 RepID=A0A7J0FS65_9ERIC|nr:hypothetical protein Acr_14g0006750 [Actinidia rufa]